MRDYSGLQVSGEPEDQDNSLQALAALVRGIDQRIQALQSQVNSLRELLSGQQIVKEWYTTGELASAMQVSAYTVQERWCNQGRIECEKDPNTGRWRIPGQEVRRLTAGGNLNSPRVKRNGDS